MYVNGDYVSQKHPLWKPGRFKIEGVFGSVENEDDKSKRGYIYCISNPAWPDLIKVGKAEVMEKRLNAYQTYSPFRDFKLEWSIEVDDRHTVEAAFHEGRKTVNGEWYFMSAHEAYCIVQSIPQVGGLNAANDNHLVQARVA
jgi:hypothetical protein